MTVAASCRGCGAEPRADARFCDACGTPLGHVSAEAEYKQVTVLFADVVHSMDIAAAVGAERLREIMTELFDRSSAVVLRYGGTVDKFTGDGLMAVFGAPVALEDHALRACLAALDIQREAQRIATEVEQRDHGLALLLRIGLNSGAVIAGEIGSGRLNYTAVGEQVGLAQRMESVAPPGGVMLSESTARLVEHATDLGEPEKVRIKGAQSPVIARRLLAMAPERGQRARQMSTLVGRDWEMSTIAAMLEQSMNGKGRIVGLVGPPGIGKSRMVGEIASIAAERSVQVFTRTANPIPARSRSTRSRGLLRDIFAIDGLEDDAARANVRARMQTADPEDLILLDDLLGIRDNDTPLPAIEPDARGRRLAALLNAAAAARTTPAVYVIEDAHWIDEVSEAMIAAVRRGGTADAARSCSSRIGPSTAGCSTSYRARAALRLHRWMIRSRLRWPPSCWVRIVRSPRSSRRSPNGQPATPSSPRRSSETSPNGAYWTANPATMCLAATPPTCRYPRPCRQPSPPASIASARLPNVR